MNTVCACSQMREKDDGLTIDHLERIRDECPALRLLLLPDPVWSEYRIRQKTQVDVGHHESSILIALRRGVLSKITMPIHRFLLRESTVRSDVRSQYRKDLAERWMLDPGVGRRHQKWRIYQGRMVELQFALWLDEHGRRVKGLEALCEGPDIETEDRESDWRTVISSRW